MCHNGGMGETANDTNDTNDTEQRSGRLPSTFSPERMEAFSDGVLAVIITIMVLEIRRPDGADIGELGKIVPALLIYLLSFTVIGIYWNNHHHLLRVTRHIDGAVMWANLHLLFWLSLIPIATNWTGEHHDAPWPAAIYGAIAVMAAVAYYILMRFIIRANKDTDIERALGNSVKDIVSPTIYLVGVGLAFIPHIGPLLSYLAYATVALIWFIPDRRLVRR